MKTKPRKQWLNAHPVACDICGYTIKRDGNPGATCPQYDCGGVMLPKRRRK
jgi:hypothetical protein